MNILFIPRIHINTVLSAVQPAGAPAMLLNGSIDSYSPVNWVFNHFAAVPVVPFRRFQRAGVSLCWITQTKWSHLVETNNQIEHCNYYILKKYLKNLIARYIDLSYELKKGI